MKHMFSVISTISQALKYPYRKVTFDGLSRPSIAYVLLLTIFVGTAQTTRANSGNLFYTNLGNDRYEVIFHYYRICGGSGYSTTYPGTVSAGCGTATFTLTRDSIWDVSQTCPKNRACTTNTTSGNGYSIQRYRAILNFRDSAYRKFLGGSCCDVELSVTGRTRGSFYTGFNGASPIRVSAGLSLCKNKGPAPGNSSSRQLYHWQYLQFLNQPNYQSFLATDPDGDSLSYELVPCLDWTSSGSVTYNTNYGYTYPLSVYCTAPVPPCTPNPGLLPPTGFYLNAVTGDLVYQPVNSGDISAVAVRINEFRRDSSGTFVRIGYSMVEGYLLVNNPGNNAPWLSNPRVENICEKDPYCFTFTYSDNRNPAQTVPDTPALRFLTNIGNYTTKILGKTINNVFLLQTCFTPPASDSAVNLLYFSVAADDRYCGTSYESRRTHAFRVLPKPKTSLITKVHGGSRYSIRVENKDTLARMEVLLTGPKGYRFQVKEIRSFFLDTLQLFKKGNYYLRVYTRRKGFCDFYQYDTINMYGCLEMFPNIRAKSAYCRSEESTFSVLTTNTIGTLKYRWYNRNGQTLSSNDTLRIRLRRDSFIYLRIDDDLGCYALDSFPLYGYLPSAQWTIPDGGICNNNEAPELETWLNTEPRNTGSWQAPAGILEWKSNRVYFASSLPVRRDTMLPLYFSLQDSLGCRRNDTLWIPVRYTRSLALRDTGICLGSGTFQMENLLDGADTSSFRLRWFCYNPGMLTPEEVHRGGQFKASTPGTYGFMLWNTDTTNGCAGRDSFRISLASPPVYNVYTASPICDNSQGTDIQRYAEVFVTAPKYRWEVLSVNSRPADSSQRKALFGTWFRPGQAGLWRLRFEEYSTGCVRSDSIGLLVYAAPRPYLGADTIIPIGSSIRLNAGNYTEYLWDDNSMSQFRAIESVALSTVPRPFWVRVKDGTTGCSGSDTILISRSETKNIRNTPAPEVRIFPNPFGNMLEVQGQGIRSCRLLFPDGRLAAGAAGRDTLMLRTETLPAGIYLLEYTGTQGTQREQVWLLR
jgi:hypothetical protein